jgi:RNA polymerase sigma-70 factor (ECF subfamily)
LQALSSSRASVDGDPDSNLTVEALVQTQLPWIRRRLRSLFPSHLDLDELEQKVLLNVLRSLPSYRGEGSLRAWVDSITLRVGLSHARRVRARERREQALAEGLGDFQQPLPSDAYFTRRQVQGLLSVLPPEQERAVVLHHVIGLEVSEVAEHQGVPTETARSRLRLGMQKLRSRARVREIALR